MKNRYPGTCYRCGRHCGVGEGLAEKFQGGWRVQHAICAAVAEEADPREREKRIEFLRHHALQTGQGARRARRELRLLGIMDGEE